MNATYLRMEILRTFRNRRFFIFSLVIPLVFFFLVAGANKNNKLGGIAFPAYYLAGMTSFGTMMAMLSNGGRIAGERAIGWNRQLRMTPLTPQAYFVAKLTAAYLMSSVTLALLLLGGLTMGVHEDPAGVLKTIGYVAVGLIPFAGLGVFLGHLLNVDSIGPVMGGGVSILAFVGGAWGPFGGTDDVAHQVSEATPTYWLVQAGHTVIGGPGWSARGWWTIAIWSVVLGRLALLAYQRDTKRQ